MAYIKAVIIINTSKDLNYRLYLQKNSGFIRTSFNREYERYFDIQNGNIEKVKKNLIEIKKDYLAGKGKLSEIRIRNIRYHVIISAAIIARACVEGGMPHDVAYTLSDIYILKADTCETEEKLIELMEAIQLDYTERMRMIVKEKAVSKRIRECIDYIYEHLNEKLSVRQLAKEIRINESYLSKLFIEETGITIKEFVHNAKVKTAENMLRYSDFSYSEIAFSLGFSSQSAFSSIFKSHTGYTPKKFRDCFFDSSDKKKIF